MLNLHAQAVKITALMAQGFKFIGTEQDSAGISTHIIVSAPPTDDLAYRVYSDGSMGPVKVDGVHVSALGWHRAHYPHRYDSPESPASTGDLYSRADALGLDYEPGFDDACLADRVADGLCDSGRVHNATAQDGWYPCPGCLSCDSGAPC